MYNLKKSLINTKTIYEGLLKKLSKMDIGNFDGSINVTKSNKIYQFYIRKYNEKTGTFDRKYISKKNNLNLIKSMLNDQYRKKLKSLLEKRLKKIDSLLKDFEYDEIDKVFLSFHPEKQKYIRPIQATKEQIFLQWKNTNNDSLFRTDSQIISTNKGDLVRSKSEKIIADALYRRDIEYKYESLYDIGGKKFRPDFTIMNPYTNEIIIWEHFGMMDNINYLNNALMKIELYDKYGFIIGKNFIATFESSSKYINPQYINSIIERIFL